MVLPVMLCTIWMTAAALVFGRFIERGKMSDALCFGLLAALAILTDRTGFALVFFVPLALFFSKEWRLLRTAPFWSGIAMGGLLAGPLAWHFRRLEWTRVSFDFTRAALPFYATQLVAAFGIVIVVLAVPMIIATSLRPAQRSAKWAVAAALLAATVLFSIVTPADLDPLHLLPAVAPVIMFTVAGCAPVAKRFGRSTAFVLLMAGVLTVAFFEKVFVPWRTKNWSGFRPLAEAVLEADERPNARVLVCSDRTGEGMFVSEMAMGETQPGRRIERADNFFANTKFDNDEDLSRLLLNQRFEYIVFDESDPGLDRGPLHQMLRRVLRDNPDHFWEMSASPVIRDAIPQQGFARLYRVRGGG